MVCVSVASSEKTSDLALARVAETRVNMEESLPLNPVKGHKSTQERSNGCSVIIGTAAILLFIILLGLITLFTNMTNSESSSLIHGREASFFHDWFINAGSNISIAKDLRELTKRSHVAGTPQDMENAMYVQNRFEQYGLAVHSVDYKVLLSYPVSRSLFMSFPTTGRKIEVCLDEGYNNKSVIQPFHAGSPSGSVVGEVVYVNYGLEEDFTRLAQMGVNVSGAIVIARYGDVYRGTVVRTAAKFGAVAVIMYSDPQQFGGNGTQGFFPKSKWLPPDGAQFGTVIEGKGDPSTPGWPSTEKSERVSDISDKFPSIPSMPISAEEAQHILGSLQGPSVPSTWRGSLNFEGVGRGPGVLNFSYVANRTMSTIRNVFAVIKGSDEPDRFVILGNHRDAWTYGAVDPNSGTAALLEIARKLGALLGKGWQPRRSMILCSWDAEEYGMMGSTEWVEQNFGNLYAKAVAYLNVDCAVQGPGFFAGATPQLDALLIEVTKQVKDPDFKFKTVYDSWTTKHSETKVKIDRLGGSGSDFAAFLQHVGVPSIDIYFGESYPVYHTIYDCFEWMEKFGDPTFQRHVAVSSIWGLLALRLADDHILPFDYSVYANELQSYEMSLKEKIGTSRGITIEPIHLAIKQFVDVTNHTTLEAKELRKYKGDYHLILKGRIFNDRLMLTERAFLDSKGLKGRSWFKHLIYAPSQNNEYSFTSFPGVMDAMKGERVSNEDGDPDVQHEIWRVSRKITQASIILEGKLT